MKLPEITEEQSRFLDLVPKIATLAVAALGFVWTIYTLIDQHNQSTKQSDKQHQESLGQQKHEFEKGLWDKRLEAYLKAWQEASSIADATRDQVSFARHCFDSINFIMGRWWSLNLPPCASR